MSNIENTDEEVEVEVVEITMNEDDIDEWIGKLVELKEEKGEITLEADDENEIIIKYEEKDSDEEDEGEEDDEEEE